MRGPRSLASTKGAPATGEAPLRPTTVDSVAGQHSYQQALTDLSLL